MIGVINLENHDSLTWKLFLYYHNNHFYLFFLFVIFSINSTVTMQIEVLLLKLSLPDMFCSSSSYFIWISWKCSDLVYSPATINKHPLVSDMNFHGVWGEKKKWRSISVQFSSVAQLCPTLCVVAATNKSAPNRWLKTTKIYSLPVGQNSRGQNQGISQPLPRDSREDSIARLSQLLVTASISWLVAATLQSLSLCSHYLCACPVSLGFPVIWALVLVFRTHPGKSGQLLIGSPQI